MCRVWREGKLPFSFLKRKNKLRIGIKNRIQNRIIKIKCKNPKLAKFIISQYGGPDGELGASLRYLSQRYSMPFDELKGLLTDIGTYGSKWYSTKWVYLTIMLFSDWQMYVFCV